MKKGFLYLCGFALVATMTMVSCSSEEETPAATEASENQTKFEKALNDVNASLAEVDFNELTELYNELKAGTVAVSLNGKKMGQSVGGLLELLKSLFEGLQVDGYTEASPSYHKHWVITNLQKTLNLVFDLGFNLDEIAIDGEDGGFMLQRKYVHQVDLTTSSGTQYSVFVFVEKSTTHTQVSQLGFVGFRNMVIKKNGVQVLTVNTNNISNAGMDESKLINERLIMGDLTYKDHLFIYTFSGDELSDISRSLSYTKGGKNILSASLRHANNLSWETLKAHDAVFTGEYSLNVMEGVVAVNGEISNINKFYVDGLALAVMALTGTTQEKCQQLTDDFNSIVTSSLVLGQNNLGMLSLQPVLADAERNIYMPTIVATSPLFDGEPLTLNEIFDRLGLTMEGLLNMLLGKS